MLRHPCILGGPNAKHGEQNQKWSPTKGDKIRSGPQQRGTKSEVAASTLPSRGPKRGRKCYVTHAFSGVPNTKRVEQNQKWSPAKGNKIRNGCLTPAFLGAQKRVEMLRNPAFLGVPEHGFKKGPHQASGKKPHGS